MGNWEYQFAVSALNFWILDINAFSPRSQLPGNSQFPSPIQHFSQVDTFMVNILQFNCQLSIIMAIWPARA